MSTILAILIAIILLFIIILFAKGIRVIPQASAMIIERLGRYHKTLKSGFNVIIPIIDRPRTIDVIFTKKMVDGRVYQYTKVMDKLDLRETVYDFPRQNVITRDNVVIEIDAIIYYQIMDPFKATYEIANYPDAIEKLTKTTLRNVIGEMDLDETLSSRDKINNRLRIILDEATDKWGIKINRVEIQDINPPKDIKDAMEKQMRAERDRRAIILSAEGEKQAAILQSEGIKQSAINKADGDKQAKILQAEGEAQAKVKIAEAEAVAIKTIAAAISSTKTDPGTYLIALKYIEAFKELSTGKDNKTVFMPFESSSILASLGSIKEIFKQ
ncbi:MAG: SPFH/Band 7/PHB domain protein [Spirochaetes bacterium]|nr:SPFH/Band 7/PHB domain protein [Spirochaetota bacterium]NLJ04407.1 SPFH/Band 7/PHB domain protein [Exilispira sp.]MBP8991343.1 SPFH/Band 7/PHB domain protein [Spirochaetota bacterium]HOV46221.1 SPFH domain-containing protein [Exilispira sp.]HPB48051.1 SPFH domain-containing protein [Exilispira sp.]